MMQTLEDELGDLEGDAPMHSPVNIALDLRGQGYFFDLLDWPDLAEHLHRVIADTIAEIGCRIKACTGTVSTSIMRIKAGFMPEMPTIPNGKLQMISPDLPNIMNLWHLAEQGAKR